MIFYRRYYRVSLAALLALVAGSISAQPSRAQENGGSEDIILGAWSDPLKCNRSTARQYSFNQVVTSGTALIGRCVAVEGYWAARALFGKQSDADKVRSNSERKLRDRRVGIYARDEIFAHAPKRGTRYTLVGIIGQCDVEWPNAVMVMGYCHYTDGPIIKVAEVIATPARNVR
jgi:hypothetical protein